MLAMIGGINTDIFFESMSTYRQWLIDEVIIRRYYRIYQRSS